MMKEVLKRNSTAQQTKALEKGEKRKARKTFLGKLFEQETASEISVVDEKEAFSRYRNLTSLIKVQFIVIGILVIIMVFGSPIMRPYHIYRTVSPEKAVKELNPLFAPNLTDRAIISWAATSVTEIMTLGFGDFDQQLEKQRDRFTYNGWISFLKAIALQNIRDAFKQKQLVLTTVPMDIPVIIAQGKDKDNTYKWIVELPVIMTFATNNNVTRKIKTVIRLTIVRVPNNVNRQGMGIEKWETV